MVRGLERPNTPHFPTLETTLNSEVSEEYPILLKKSKSTNIQALSYNAEAKSVQFLEDLPFLHEHR
jgi:hypothetical protein